MPPLSWPASSSPLPQAGEVRSPALPSPSFHVVKPPMDATNTPSPAPAARKRRIHWLNVLTVISAAILIGAEVFGAAFAGSWALATLFELGGFGARVLDVLLLLIGLAVMVQFVRNAHQIEPFTE